MDDASKTLIVVVMSGKNGVRPDAGVGKGGIQLLRQVLTRQVITVGKRRMVNCNEQGPAVGSFGFLGGGDFNERFLKPLILLAAGVWVLQRAALFADIA